MDKDTRRILNVLMDVVSKPDKETYTHEEVIVLLKKRSACLMQNSKVKNSCNMDRMFLHIILYI